MKTAVVLVTDQRGLLLTQHAAAAALQSQTAKHDYWIFCDGFFPPNSDALISSAQRLGINLTYAPITDTSVEEHNLLSHVSSTTMLKFAAIAKLIPSYERVLYIDGDVLLMKEFGLQSIDFESHAIAAVYDIAECAAITCAEFNENCLKSGQSPHYFNAGVIAVDSAKWNTEELQPLYSELCRQHRSFCGYKTNCASSDQCAWNLLFSKDWKRLPLTMNFQACAMFSEKWKYATARHYVGKNKYLPYKPWRNDEADIRLINEARSLLGLPPRRTFALTAIRQLNNWRNRRQNAIFCEAIDYIEKRYAESF